jgi:hypothetical protein
MSTLDIVGQMDSKSVQTSVAQLLGRSARLNDLLTRQALGCVDLCCVCPEECKYTLETECGKIRTKSVDLACVPEVECCPPCYPCKPCDPCNPCCKKVVRCITINLNTCRPCRCNCDETENQVAPDENAKIAIVHSCDCDCDYGCEPKVPVKICLTNDCAPVESDEHGNPVPCSYLVSPGQIKFLCVVNGRITRIVN